MNKLSKYLSVLALSVTILAPISAQAAWGPWYLDTWWKDRVWSGGSTIEVLHCHYQRNSVSAWGESEYKHIKQYAWSAGGLKCPDPSSLE